MYNQNIQHNYNPPPLGLHHRGFQELKDAFLLGSWSGTLLWLAWTCEILFQLLSAFHLAHAPHTQAHTSKLARARAHTHTHTHTSTHKHIRHFESVAHTTCDIARQNKHVTRFACKHCERELYAHLWHGIGKQDIKFYHCWALTKFPPLAPHTKHPADLASHSFLPYALATH
jgi:hypothetical protein